jgi:murein DD-endopeptidase MepM/ murein hydrolase activator NlpD
VCPVSNGTYINDWGFPRSDARFHEGNDIFAPRGTEVLAPVGGEIKLITGTVGGLQFYLHGDDGTTYIGTHLDAFGRSGRVEAGQVIGYVGDTGNARGGPAHLHFEMHPGDGRAVNPYPTLRAAGC